jgi:phage terminase large subunit-like protein
MPGKRKDSDPVVWRPPGWQPVGPTVGELKAKKAARGDAYSIRHDEMRLKGLARDAGLNDDVRPAMNPEPELPNLNMLSDAQLIELSKKLALADRYDWKANARPEQVEPESYRNWLLMGGRGMGKTRTGAETVRFWTDSGMKRIAIIAKGSRELRDVCFEGVSGLLQCYPPDQVASYRKGLGDTYLNLTNGAKIIGYSAEAPDAIRGQAFDAIWGDEFAAWPKHLAQDMYDQAWFCMRESENPRMILTTTPKRVPHLMDFLERAEDPKHKIIITKGKTTDNKHLSEAALEELYARYEGTHLGRQELDGELLADVEGALWRPEMVEHALWIPTEDYPDLPRFRKIICAVDPSGSATGDATGIVVVGYTFDKRIFVLGCYSTKGLAAFRYNAVCLAAHKHGASEILYEANFSGDNAALGIENQWKHLVRVNQIESGRRMPFIKPSTLKGDKAVKASPVSALYEQQMRVVGVERIRHVAGTKANGMNRLESELLSWAVGDKQSPNSLDALVIGARRCMRELGWEQGGPGSAGKGRRIDGGWTPF